MDINNFKICTKEITEVLIDDKLIRLIPGCVLQLTDRQLTRNKWCINAITKGYLRSYSPCL